MNFLGCLAIKCKETVTFLKQKKKIEMHHILWSQSFIVNFRKLDVLGCGFFSKAAQYIDTVTATAQHHCKSNAFYYLQQILFVIEVTKYFEQGAQQKCESMQTVFIGMNFSKSYCIIAEINPFWPKLMLTISSDFFNF